MIAFAAHTSYEKRLDKVLSFVVMGASEDFLHLTNMSCMKYNVCVYVCKTTNWRLICLIICNCIYIVVINCGWNNNVAVKIVACWHWNIYIHLHDYLSLLYTLDVSRSTWGNPVRLSILWVKVCAGQPIWFCPLKLNFSNDSRGPVQWVTLHTQVKIGISPVIVKKQVNKLHS